MARRMRELEVQYASLIPTLFLGFVIILFVSGGTFLAPLIDAIAGLLLGVERGLVERRRSRQAGRHVTGRVSRSERSELEAWLSPPQLALFESMHRADQRHGLDVVAHLRADGHTRPRAAAGGPAARLLQGPLGAPAASRGVVARRALR